MFEFVGIDATTALGLAGLVLFYAVGFFHILHALMRTRTSQGTIAWVVSLLTMPFIAIPLYWLLGRNKFMGYVRARRGNDKEMAKLAEEMSSRVKGYAVDLPEENVFERAAQELGGLPFTSGNQLELLVDGDETFERIFEAIEGAQEYICVNFYIVKSDKVGMRFQRALIARAKAGVKVYFLYDEVGSYKLSATYLGELKDSGVECESFGANRMWWSRFQLNFRNHRKIVVVDGKEALLGGLNVGDEYLGRSVKFGNWRDTHMAMRGPSVQAVQLVFMEDWFWACDRVPELNWEIEIQEEDQVAAIIPTGPADPVESWKLLVAEAANSARKKLWIASPYFVPDDGVLTALQLAALRGVDVRIMLPDKPDHILVWLSAFSYYEDSIPYGVKLFRYQEGFLHQKVMLIDGRMAAVGTANLDNRSFRLNFEVTAFVSGAKFVSEVEGMLETDFGNCREVAVEEFTEKSFLFRVACRAARLMAPVQ
ncbi:MAG: cardiolipin synthase [Akkermansiaceae bacterium]|jgi:cardiolipin synthase A/B|nr:cardiolipin synthase [Akkermansiaceae bacterium]